VHARDGASLSEVLGYTLSAGIMGASPTMRLFDPFCGSGTTVIEAVYAWMGLPTPPLPRAFAFQDWPVHNELEYNTLLHDWARRYEDIIQTYIATFGASKALWKAGETPADALSLDNFPLFVGSDLRAKAVMSSVNNARDAGVGLFTQFYQGDFEDVISEAGTAWVDLLVQQEKAREERMRRARTAPRAGRRSGGLGVDRAALRDEANEEETTASAAAVAEPAFGTKRSETLKTLPKAGASRPSNIVTLDAMGAVRPVPKQDARGRPLLDLPYPYLKGYTMVSNIPWGVSDEDTRGAGGRRAINTTQQESMESLYMRLGRSLYRHSHMFRDVFVLSAHANFERHTRLGAERAAREDEGARAGGLDAARRKDVMLRNQVVKSQGGGAADFKWEKICSFYNNGVKTHLLKLDTSK